MQHSMVKHGTNSTTMSNKKCFNISFDHDSVSTISGWCPETAIDNDAVKINVINLQVVLQFKSYFLIHTQVSVDNI